MSFNNHDADDPIGKRYGKITIKPSKEFQEFANKLPKLNELSDDNLLNGRAIKIYTMASTMPLKDFMKWYKESLSNP